MISPELKTVMKDVKQEIDQNFSEIYRLPDNNPYEKTSEAMKHMALLGDGGKRIRPILTYLANQLFNGKEGSYLSLAIAVENIHTYTLIIDDIQDGDEIRRGEDTCHKKYGINTALLTAPRLYERGIMSFYMQDHEIAPMVHALLDKLHQGQAGDLEAEEWQKSQRTEEAWCFIASGKTGALLQLALLGGAISAGVTKAQDLLPLMEYGYNLGLVFQAKDDILGAIGNTEETGKAVGADDALNKFTFYTLNDKNLEKAEKHMNVFVNNGISALQIYDVDKVKLLSEIMNYAAFRMK